MNHPFPKMYHDSSNMCRFLYEIMDAISFTVKTQSPLQISRDCGAGQPETPPTPAHHPHAAGSARQRRHETGRRRRGWSRPPESPGKCPNAQCKGAFRPSCPSEGGQTGTSHRIGDERDAESGSVPLDLLHRMQYRAAYKVLVSTRMKRSGQRWSRDGSQGVLTYWSLLRSDRFDRAWAVLARSLAAMEAADNRQRQPRPGARRMIRFSNLDPGKTAPYGNRSPANWSELGARQFFWLT